jgi:hypothetical protein
MSYYGTEREIIENLEKKITYWQDLAVANRRVAEDAQAQRDKALVALKEIREVWAGAEVGVPHFAQEAYVINLCKQMYSLAVGAMKECGK